MSFSQLRISSDILKGLKDGKVDAPSPLQKKVVNAVKGGGDLLIRTTVEEQAEIGYLVPVLDHIARQDRKEGTKAIILTNSPERTAEIGKRIETTGAHAGIKHLIVDEAGDRDAHRSGLSAGPSVIVATPSVLAELMEQNRMVFREARYLVLDGAEGITDWVAVDVINKRIIGRCERIATADATFESLPGELHSLLSEPESISGRNTPEAVAKADAAETEDEVDSAEAAGTAGVADGTEAAEGTTDSADAVDAAVETAPAIPKQLTQYYIKVPPRRKISTLMARIEEEGEKQILIFTASRRTADRLYRIFRKNGLKAVSLGKGLNEETMKDRLARFTGGEARYLIAGEIPAGDLALDEIARIINYDVPEEVEEYRQRADLTRSVENSRIVSLVSKQDRGDIKEIIEQLGYAPEELPLPEEVPAVKTEKKGDDQEAKETEKPKAKQSSRDAGKGSKDSGKGGRDSGKGVKDSGKGGREKGRGGRDGRKGGSKSSSRRSGGRGKRPRPGSVTRDVGEPSGLPRPSYDKLSGGRSGEKDKKEKGILGIFKRLFS